MHTARLTRADARVRDWPLRPGCRVSSGQPMRSPRSGRAEYPGKLQVETRQKRCRQHITGLAGELDCATELTAFASIDSDDVHLGIDEPVLGYACSLVQTQLDCLVAAAS